MTVFVLLGRQPHQEGGVGALRLGSAVQAQPVIFALKMYPRLAGVVASYPRRKLSFARHVLVPFPGVRSWESAGTPPGAPCPRLVSRVGVWGYVVGVFGVLVQ